MPTRMTATAMTVQRMARSQISGLVLSSINPTKMLDVRRKPSFKALARNGCKQNPLVDPTSSRQPIFSTDEDIPKLEWLHQIFPEHICPVTGSSVKPSAFSSKPKLDQPPFYQVRRGWMQPKG
ncbi:hypothetical protein HPP92_022421 [Vanilla planifolia]|uniref:Uncharacterized protein n=1 Tax=Vanilla planifolia TaxID=51239 RepID=A0A835UFE4_VANPL|nr:hypothetical protein HPP92_022421 [Vanilla planifolia]